MTSLICSASRCRPTYLHHLCTTTLNTLFNKIRKRLDLLISTMLLKQEVRAVAGNNYRAIRDTCTEILHLIIGQRDE